MKQLVQLLDNLVQVKDEVFLTDSNDLLQQIQLTGRKNFMINTINIQMNLIIFYFLIINTIIKQNYANNRGLVGACFLKFISFFKNVTNSIGS